MVTKKELTAFLGDNFPVNFRFPIECSGRELENITKPVARQLEESFKKQNKFNIINARNDHGENQRDIYIYHDFGGFTYIDIIIFNQSAFNDFINAFMEFCSSKGELKIEDRKIKLIIDNSD